MSGPNAAAVFEPPDFGQDVSLGEYLAACPAHTSPLVALGASHARIELRDVYSFAETYQVGVLEGPSRVTRS